MQGDQSLYLDDWLRIAEADLVRVTRLTEIEEPIAAGFYLQQAVEKFLKAYLLSKGWDLQRTHDLEALLNLALDHDESIDSYRAVCQEITAYYFIDRYPGTPTPSLTARQVRESRDDATASSRFCVEARRADRAQWA